MDTVVVAGNLAVPPGDILFFKHKLALLIPADIGHAVGDLVIGVLIVSLLDGELRHRGGDTVGRIEFS